jgi:hypothetical protein
MPRFVPILKLLMLLFVVFLDFITTAIEFTVGCVSGAENGDGGRSIA